MQTIDFDEALLPEWRKREQALQEAQEQRTSYATRAWADYSSEELLGILKGILAFYKEGRAALEAKYGQPYYFVSTYNTLDAEDVSLLFSMAYHHGDAVAIDRLLAKRGEY